MAERWISRSRASLNFPCGKITRHDDLGLSEKQIHNATIIRDAVEANVQAIENRKSVLRAVNSPLHLVIHTK